MSTTSAGAPAARSNNEILAWLETQPSHRSPAPCWRRAGRSTTSRTRRRATPCCRGCSGATPRAAAATIATMLGEGPHRSHDDADARAARADRRPGAGAQASDRELPAAGAAHRAAAAVLRGRARRRRAAASRDMAGAPRRGGEISQRAVDRSGGGALRPRHLLAVRRPRACSMSTRTISARSAPKCCIGTSSAISDGCTATARRSDARGNAHIPLTMFSVIFLASPSSIMVLSR